MSVAASWAVAFDRLAADDPAALRAAHAARLVRARTGAADPAHRPPRRLPAPARRGGGRSAGAGPVHRGCCTGGHGHRAPRTACSCTGSRPPCCAPAPATSARLPGLGRGGGPAAARARCRTTCGTTRRCGRAGSSCCRTCWPPSTPTAASTTVADELSLAARPGRRLPATRGEPRAALPLFRRAYAAQPGPARRRPPRHPGLGQQPRHRPAARWVSTSRPAHLDEDTLTRRRRVLGDDHPDTLTSASNLAVDLHALGEYQQARALDEDTLTRPRRVLGDDHPDTLISANNLAATCTRWASTSRPATSTRTPSPAAGGSWATTTPTPSSRPATSPPTCTGWASTSRRMRWKARSHHCARNRRTGQAPSDRHSCARARTGLPDVLGECRRASKQWPADRILPSRHAMWRPAPPQARLIYRENNSAASLCKRRASDRQSRNALARCPTGCLRCMDCT